MKDINEIIASIQEQIDSSVLLDSYYEVPKYAEISKNKELFYNTYGEVVDRYNSLCNRIHKLQYLQITISSIAKEFSSSGFGQIKRVATSHEKVFLKMREDCSKLLDAYKPLKDSFEATLKFYNSMQYLLNNYRMEDV